MVRNSKKWTILKFGRYLYKTKRFWHAISPLRTLCARKWTCVFVESWTIPHQLWPIDTKALESFDGHKVLGVTIQSNLKWDLHINEVVPKASKRLHILRVLKRGEVPPADLLEVYFALIRSSSSFSCSVAHGILLWWHWFSSGNIQFSLLGRTRWARAHQTYKDQVPLLSVRNTRNKAAHEDHGSLA